MSEDKFKYVLEPGVLDVDAMRRDGLYPDDERIKQGAVAVFECAQEIPCNPCEKACRKGYIKIGEEITRMPELDERCNGCGLCVPSCPGLSIFILNWNYSDSSCSVTMPYEFLPLPKKGEIVDALDRRGERICDGEIVSVRKMSKGEICNSLTVAVPKEFIHDVRHVRRKNV